MFNLVHINTIHSRKVIYTYIHIASALTSAPLYEMRRSKQQMLLQLMQVHQGHIIDDVETPLVLRVDAVPICAVVIMEVFHLGKLHKLDTVNLKQNRDLLSLPFTLHCFFHKTRGESASGEPYGQLDCCR